MKNDGTKQWRGTSANAAISAWSRTLPFAANSPMKAFRIAVTSTIVRPFGTRISRMGAAGLVWRVGRGRCGDGASGATAFALTYLVGQRALADDPFVLQPSLQR